MYVINSNQHLNACMDACTHGSTCVNLSKHVLEFSLSTAPQALKKKTVAMNILLPSCSLVVSGGTRAVLATIGGGLVV